MPIQNSHSVYENDDIGLYVGVWDTTTMIEKAGAYPCDEFMWLIEGEVEIKNCKTGQMQKVKAGEAFVIPKGYDCQWHQSGYLRKFYLISDHPDEAIPDKPAAEQILIISSRERAFTEKLEQSFHPSPTNCVSYKNNTGKFYTGSWNSDSFESNFRPFPVNEMVHIITGTLVLTEESGQQYIFEKGDTFFVPKDVICKWQSENFVEVLYAVVES